MDAIKVKMVKEAEEFVARTRLFLEDFKHRVMACMDPVEKEKLKNALEQDQYRFSQMMADIVIFKAAHGIFTDPPETKKLK